MNRSAVRMIRWLMAALAGCLMISAGCKSNDPKQEEPFVQAYAAGKYGEAMKLAETKAATAEGDEKERASLVAGMSAYALGQQDVASRWLRPLVTSKDTQIAGRANWTLGQIASEKGKNDEATKLLITAAGQLNGDDSARASMLAGDCFRRLKLEDQAKEQYALAAKSVQDPAIRTMIEQRQAGQMPQGVRGPTVTASSTGPFTIQLGAFSNKQAADAQAASAAAQAKRANAAAPVVATSSDASGRVLYAVRIGEYPTREQATAVLGRLGISSAKVIAIRK